MHVAILKGYTSGLDLKASDVLLLVDVVPNRPVEKTMKYYEPNLKRSIRNAKTREAGEPNQ